MMSDKEIPGTSASRLTRRQVIAGVAIAVGSLAAGSEVLGKNAPQGTQGMNERTSTGADTTRTSLHQEIAIQAGPERIYEALLDSKRFAAFTGMRAEIGPQPGGAFVMFGGLIEGRNVELVPNRRIVQAWRPASWDPGVYSIVRFELTAHTSGTVVVLDHTGFPEGKFAGLDSGWHERYWEPLKKFFA
jgi:activator of HSP90 ATPase